MKPVTKRKLSKSIVDLYYRNNQKLYVTSYIVFNGKTDYYVEIVITDKSKNPFNKNSIWLFDIQTLSDFYESHIRGYDIIIKDYNKEDVYETSQVCKASYTPFYMNRVFTLKKFGNITEEDISKLNI